MNKKALLVVTNTETLGDTNKKTGFYLDEASHAYWPLINDGFEVDIASPSGGLAPIDMKSWKLDDPENKSFVEKFNVKTGLMTKALKDIDPSKYGVIYFAGGTGAMWDFPDNPDINRITRSIYENGGIVSAVCHGPAALTGVKLANGKPLIQGRDISAFTNDEETEVEQENIVPFMLETKLREMGGLFQWAPNWQDKVVVSDRLITGQNPQSASSVAKAVVNAFTRIESITKRPPKASGLEQRPGA